MKVINNGDDTFQIVEINLKEKLDAINIVDLGNYEKIAQKFQNRVQRGLVHSEWGQPNEVARRDTACSIDCRNVCLRITGADLSDIHNLKFDVTPVSCIYGDLARRVLEYKSIDFRFALRAVCSTKANVGGLVRTLVDIVTFDIVPGQSE